MKWLASLVLGAAAGYIYAMRRLERDYNDRLKAEVDEIREYYRSKEERKKDSPRMAVKPKDSGLVTEKAQEALRNYQGVKPPAPVTHTQEVVKKEDKPVENKKIEIISEEEFIDSDTDYKQFSISYYRGDNILAGQSDQEIGKSERIIMLGSRILDQLQNDEKLEDGDTIYVRNHEAKWEFEIRISEGKYTAEVLGMSE